MLQKTTKATKISKKLQQRSLLLNYESSNSMLHEAHNRIFSVVLCISRRTYDQYVLQ